MAEPRRKRRKTFLLAAAAVALSIVLLALSHNCFSTFAPRSTSPEGNPDFDLIAEAWNTIQQVYVDRSALKPKNITHGAISGMVDSLGDTGHSAFLTPDMIRQEREYTEGSYKGVGLELRLKDGHALIVAPLDGSPAQKAGLHSGEIITKVDGKSLIGLELVAIVKLILGPEGTRVTLTVFDPKTDASRDVTLTRASIKIQNVRWRHLPGTSLAYLRIGGFTEGVSKALHEALHQLEVEKTAGIVLDLRDDPGGLLVEAIRSTSQFLQEGNVLLIKNAAGEIKRVPVLHEWAPSRLPVVVLVNEGTASAAEIIAGAIKDAGRGTVLGKRTFGTGTVLQQFNLSDGSALLLAVEEWLTPKGHSIWHKGITPDVEVSLPPGAQPLLPYEESDLTAATLQSSSDTQLLAAIKLLSQRQR